MSVAQERKIKAAVIVQRVRDLVRDLDEADTATLAECKPLLDEELAAPSSPNSALTQVVAKPVQNYVGKVLKEEGWIEW